MSRDDHSAKSHLFNVTNHHVESCGEPPVVDGDAPERYIGYFANQHGEQAIYTYDFATGEATLRMGDTGWQVVHQVMSGRAEGVILAEPERMWLRACWMASGANRTTRDAEPERSN